MNVLNFFAMLYDLKISYAGLFSFMACKTINDYQLLQYNVIFLEEVTKKILRGGQLGMPPVLLQRGQEKLGMTHPTPLAAGCLQK